MTDPDQLLLAAVINRLGRSELIDVLQNIFERLEALEPKPESETEAEEKAEAETVQAPAEEGQSSSTPSETESEPPQEERSY